MANNPVLAKFSLTVKEFVKNAPDFAELRASRHPEFDRLHVIVPSDAVTGDPVTLTVQAWDEYERLYGDCQRSFTVDTTDPDATHPDTIQFDPAADDRPGLTRSAVTFQTPGIQYVTFHANGERFVSNPVRVHENDPDERIYWGDIHLHSQYSDGAGTMAKGMRFGRDVMDLDVVAYTDHDTMGFFIPPQWQR